VLCHVHFCYTEISVSMSAMRVAISLPVQASNIGMATAEGTMLRRSVLRGAVVVFITAGYSGKKFIFERCKQLGIRSVVIDGPDSWSKSMAEDGIIEHFIAIDFSDTDTLFRRVLDACQKVCRACFVCLHDSQPVACACRSKGCCLAKHCTSWRWWSSINVSAAV
jgi:hypothetical protein